MILVEMIAVMVMIALFALFYSELTWEKPLYAARFAARNPGPVFKDPEFKDIAGR